MYGSEGKYFKKKKKEAQKPHETSTWSDRYNKIQLITHNHQIGILSLSFLYAVLKKGLIWLIYAIQRFSISRVDWSNFRSIHSDQHFTLASKLTGIGKFGAISGRYSTVI